MPYLQIPYNMRMDVSIIVPVYRRFVWIRRCIEGVIRQDYMGSFEVIVVDDGSPNASEIANALNNFAVTEKACLKYVRIDHAGPAAARNFGVRASTGRIVCFLDDDSIPDKKWLQEILRPFQESGSTGLVSGCTLSYDRGSDLPLLLEKTVYAGKSWATCNIAYRRDAFEKLGGFDESYTEPSWEDNDLGLRARWAGYSHVYSEGAIVYHPHEKDLSEYKKKCLLNGRGAAVFSRKYLLRKPLWGIGTPFVMSRRLLYAVVPSVWKGIICEAYVKFLWSLYSLKGFIGALSDRKLWKK